MTKSSEHEIAPPGAIFLSEQDLPAMLGDFGVRRALGIMSPAEYRVSQGNGGGAVEGIIRAAMQDPQGS